jgi:hypothetical protein
MLGLSPWAWVILVLTMIALYQVWRTKEANIGAIRAFIAEFPHTSTPLWAWAILVLTMIVALYQVWSEPSP